MANLFHKALHHFQFAQHPMKILDHVIFGVARVMPQLHVGKPTVGLENSNDRGVLVTDEFMKVWQEAFSLQPINQLVEAFSLHPFCGAEVVAWTDHDLLSLQQVYMGLC